ncbi:MAG: methyltransferase, partial [Oscillospiraceae bacterium]|nr:methyltransferase [Oscillospiraceae bacterium]
DIESWDWAGSAAAKNGTYLNDGTFAQMWFQTGFFERLIALLEFENAAVAILDEDSQEHVHKFFEKLTDLYIRIFDKAIETYKAPDGTSYIKAVFFHDDWGSQKAPFFSPDVCEEMIVPYMKRMIDFLHSKDVFCEFHSCGNNYLQVPNMIKAGWDAWAPQLMNDCYKIYDDFGDKLLIATFPMGVPAADELAKLPESEIRAAARSYADKCCVAGKSSFYNYYAADYLRIPAFKEELYVRSRMNYSK